MAAETLRSKYCPVEVTLTTRYPCCGGRCRLNATLHVPRETYTRRCPKCRLTWSVERNTHREGLAGDQNRVDVLNWS